MVNGEIIGRGTKRGGLYYVDDVCAGKSLSVKGSNHAFEDQLWLWHLRLGDLTTSNEPTCTELAYTDQASTVPAIEPTSTAAPTTDNVSVAFLSTTSLVPGPESPHADICEGDLQEEVYISLPLVNISFLIYVDDMIVTGDDLDEIGKLKGYFAYQFDMKDFGMLGCELIDTHIEQNHGLEEYPDQVPTDKG
ncbi:hypothetical protein Prudu_001942 [Prunus dulcis]|uniref:Reverse transcriptase Ty1/copia-type domain-containing protein n=1 Tax=Prunus dulcis TaxID=3755 RepID=A0A4Y1QPQ2_PRUDU|nr:hypothetical protein Prudu_001942 [Prunus dulcis]